MSRATFRHEAMATYFEITIAGQQESYAAQAASAAFRELDRLEGELSRYIESSDIARANRLGPGESVAIGDDAVLCLLIAAEIAEATRHAFNPAYGSEYGPKLKGTRHCFAIDPEAHRLVSRVDRLHLDLGAIGKGYALDKMAAVLGEWDVTSACLNGGGSTALALKAPEGAQGWSVGMGEGAARREIFLADRALSGSGTAVKGPHLVDPMTQQPAWRTHRVWAAAPTAAVADALSTAFFVMSDFEVEVYCAAHQDAGAALTMEEGPLLCFGVLGIPSQA
jgi:thiamine biosynthesis lipoprotein